MMQHIDEWLDAYLDGELGAAKRKQVEGHLAQCEACSRALAQRRALSALLQDAPAAAVRKTPEQFVAEVNLRIQRREPAPQTPPALPWSWQLAPLALLLALIFVQSVSFASELIAIIPGLDGIAAGSPAGGALAWLGGSPWGALGWEAITWIVPVGWLNPMTATFLIAVLYACWLALWWARSQMRSAALNHQTKV